MNHCTTKGNTVCASRVVGRSGSIFDTLRDSLPSIFTRQTVVFVYMVGASHSLHGTSFQARKRDEFILDSFMSDYHKMTVIWERTILIQLALINV